MPKRSAAPRRPPILQSVDSSAWSMSARSESWSVIGTESGSRGGFSVAVERVMGATEVGSGFGSTPSWARVTARSTRFCRSVAGPRVGRKGSQSFRWNVVDGSSHAVVENANKVFHESWNILAAFTKGWQRDRENVETVI